MNGLRQIFDPGFWYRHARKVVILVVGSTVVLIGVAMIVLPGPAVVVIPAGLAILGTEFAWARGLLRKAKAMAGKAARTAKSSGAEATSGIKRVWRRVRKWFGKGRG